MAEKVAWQFVPFIEASNRNICNAIAENQLEREVFMSNIRSKSNNKKSKTTVHTSQKKRRAAAVVCLLLVAAMVVTLLMSAFMY